MPRYLTFRAIIVLVLLFSVASPVLAGENAPDEANLIQYFPDYDIQTIESAGNTGSFASIAIDPLNDLPYISYYDEANGDLRLARPVTSGGNCGRNNTWLCETVPVPDTEATNLGHYSSIDIYRPNALSLVASKIGIAFSDQYGNVRLAEYINYVLPNLTDGWHFTNISAGLLASSFSEISFEYDSTGTPHVAYHYQISFMQITSEGLGYASYVNTGGNCGTDPNDNTQKRWQCVQIETGAAGSGVGHTPSLSFTADDRPVIAYHNSVTNQLRTATDMNGQVWNCGPGDTWSCRTIDLQGGASASAWVNPANANDVRIAHYDPVSGDLKFAYYTPTGGNCGLNIVPQFEYRCITIETMATGLASPRVSLAVGPEGERLIAYHYVPVNPQEHPVLKIARTDAGILNGNCGPTGQQPFPFKLWSCQVIDSGDAYLEEGYHLSAAFTQSGLAAVAYSEWNSHDNEYNLKLVQEVKLIFMPTVLK